jgi:hypothetical protein
VKACTERLSPAYDALSRDCEALVALFACGTTDRISEKFGNICAPSVRVRLPEGIELILIASEAYPGTPPIVLATVESQATEQIHLEWDVTAAANARLATAFSRHFVPPGPFHRVYGPSTSLPLTSDSERARAAGWPAFFSSAHIESDRISDSLFKRSQGILDRELQRCSVLVVGLGSGGSYVATQLARVGVGRIYIVDPDVVEASNLARTTYSVADIGMNKADVLMKQLININPSIEVVSHVCELADLGAGELRRIILASDLILPLTDDPKAQSVINHFSYYLGKPAVFASIYRGAHGGEVILSIPNVTPCYQCSTAQRRSVGQSVDPDADYGTQRLVGEIALGADIQHIDSATTKIALSLLLRECPDAALRKFVSGAIERGFTYLTMSTVPDYWFYPHIFRDTPGQYGYQSAWLSPFKDATCAVCGEQENRTDPAEFPLRRVRRAT